MSNDKLQYIDIANDFTEEEVAVFQPTAKKKEAAPEVQETAAAKTETPMSLDARVAAQYRGGMDIKDITRVNNISAGKIYGILNRQGVTLRTGRYKTATTKRLASMTQTEKQRLIDDYLKGKPLETMYEEYRLNKHGLYTVLDEANIPRRHKHSPTEADPAAATEETTAGVGEASYRGSTAEEFAGGTFHAVIAEPVQEKPVVADISMKDSGLHITLNKQYLQSLENINITLTLV